MSALSSQGSLARVSLGRPSFVRPSLLCHLARAALVYTKCRCVGGTGKGRVDVRMQLVDMNGPEDDLPKNLLCLRKCVGISTVGSTREGTRQLLAAGPLVPVTVTELRGAGLLKLVTDRSFSSKFLRVEFMRAKYSSGQRT